MFSILHETSNGIEKIKLLNEKTGEYLSVVPSYGGNINELVLLKNNQLHELIAGDQHIDDLSGQHINFYRGAKLSPFPNRIKDGSYVFHDNRYQLEKNDQLHALHGLLWNRPFTLEEQRVDEHEAVLVLSMHYQKKEIGFPFQYQIYIEYKLEVHALSCRTTLVNTSHKAIPIGDGWHPYFTTGTPIDRLKLELPSTKRIDMNESLIPTGRSVNDTTFRFPTLLGDTRLDHCFELDPIARIVETKLIDEQKDLTLIVWQQVSATGYNFIQVYTPPDRRSIAIEPMSCAPDAFNNKNGLTVLEPEEEVDFYFGVRLE